MQYAIGTKTVNSPCIAIVLQHFLTIEIIGRWNTLYVHETYMYTHSRMVGINLKRKLENLISNSIGMYGGE